MKKVLPAHVGIKATGGIKTPEKAEAMLHARVLRIGIPSGVSIVTATNPKD